MKIDKFLFHIDQSVQNYQKQIASLQAKVLNEKSKSKSDVKNRLRDFLFKKVE